MAQAKLFSQLIAARRLAIKVVGVGGISTAEHARQYLDAGVEAVQIATAAMVDPRVACQIRAAVGRGVH